MNESMNYIQLPQDGLSGWLLVTIFEIRRGWGEFLNRLGEYQLAKALSGACRYIQARRDLTPSNFESRLDLTGSPRLREGRDYIIFLRLRGAGVRAEMI